MAWVRFKRLGLMIEGVHRVPDHYQDILFDRSVNDGLVDVRHKLSLERLLRHGDYEIALERYGVVYDDKGIEQEASIAGVVVENTPELEGTTTADDQATVADSPAPKPKPKKRR